MWIWIAPIGTIGLCWCIAAISACSAVIIGGMEPHLEQPTTLQVARRGRRIDERGLRRTVAQLLIHNGSDIIPGAKIAWSGLWLPEDTCGGGFCRCSGFKSPRVVICCGDDASASSRACSGIFGSCGARFCCDRLMSDGVYSSPLYMDAKPFGALTDQYAGQGWKQVR